MPAVFYFDTRNVIEYLIISNIDVIRHANVDGSILDPTQDIVFDEPVVTEFWKDAIQTGINDPVIANREVVTRLPHDGIALVLRDLEPLDTETIP